MQATRFANGRAERAACEVVAEDVLNIEVEGVGSYALMWTPSQAVDAAVGYTIEDGVLTDDGRIPEILALAAGFAFSEGIVDRLADIAHMAVCPEQTDVVRLRLVDPTAASVRRRNVVINSSCGVCGGRDTLLQRLADRRVGNALRIGVADLASVRSRLQAGQAIFRRTGGTHGAAIFDASLDCLALAEDLGRHNALDKAIGQLFLAGRAFTGCGVFLSSRLSHEMLAKAARAGFEIVAAISAPSALAIDAAELAGITLCGFTRGDGTTVYTHPQRITA